MKDIEEINTVLIAKQQQQQRSSKMNYNNINQDLAIRLIDNNNIDFNMQQQQQQNNNNKKSTIIYNNILSNKLNDAQHVNKQNIITINQNQNNNFKQNYHHQHSHNNHNNHNHHNHHNNHYNHQSQHQANHSSQVQLSVQNKRKEKARIAARARRSQEASIILEMAEELHLTQEKIRRIDKATIVKLAIDYIKAFEVLCRFCCERVIYDQLQLTNQNNNNNNNVESGSRQEEEEVEQREAVDSKPDNEQEEVSRNINHAKDDDNKITVIDNNKTITTTTSNIKKSKTAAKAESLVTTTTTTMPKLSTSSIFTPKTNDMDLNFLMIDGKEGKESFVLKPDEEILEEDDLTHLAPQAGEVINLDFDSSLDDIVVDSSLFLMTPTSTFSSPAQINITSSPKRKEKYWC